jgi:hypothetical protein
MSGKARADIETAPRGAVGSMQGRVMRNRSSFGRFFALLLFPITFLIAVAAERRGAGISILIDVRPRSRGAALRPLQRLEAR